MILKNSHNCTSETLELLAGFLHRGRERSLRSAFQSTRARSTPPFGYESPSTGCSTLANGNSKFIYVRYCTLFWFICQDIYTTIQDCDKIVLQHPVVQNDWRIYDLFVRTGNSESTRSCCAFARA